MIRAIKISLRVAIILAAVAFLALFGVLWFSLILKDIDQFGLWSFVSTSMVIIGLGMIAAVVIAWVFKD